MLDTNIDDLIMELNNNIPSKPIEYSPNKPLPVCASINQEKDFKAISYRLDGQINKAQQVR